MYAEHPCGLGQAKAAAGKRLHLGVMPLAAVDDAEIGQAAHLQGHVAGLFGHVERRSQRCLGLSQVAVPEEVEAQRKLMRRALLRARRCG